MDLALDLNVVVTLLFTFLALLLASVFLRLRGGAAEPPRASGTGGETGPEDEANRLPVEEVGAGEVGKEAAAEQREGAVEPGPAAPSIPPAASSIPTGAPSTPPAAASIPPAAPNIPPAAPTISAGAPSVTPAAPTIPAGAPSVTPAAPSIPAGAPSIPPAAPSIPEGAPSIPPAAPSIPEGAPSIPTAREDEGSKIPPMDASSESSLGHTGQAEGGCGPAELSSKAEEEDPDSENEKLVVREPEDEEAADERFSFKYSPGKLRGNQYKSMMTKEELEEEQRTEDYMKLSLASS